MCKWFAIFCQGDKACIVVFGCFQFLLFFTSDESESGSFVSPVQNTGMGSLSLLQGIFPIQGSNPGLPHCRRILYQLRHKGGPISSVQFNRVWLFSTPWITACQASLSITNSLSLLKPCPSSRWCHPAISSSVVPCSSCPQSLPASGSFPMSQLLAWGGQSIGVSASASVLPMNTQDWSPLGWTGWISLQSKGLSSLLQYHSSKASIFRHSAFFIVQLSHPYMTNGKTIAFTRRTFVDKVMSLLFNMLFRLVITFLPRSKRLLTSWLQSPSAVILEPPK